MTPYAPTPTPLVVVSTPFNLDLSSFDVGDVGNWAIQFWNMGIKDAWNYISALILVVLVIALVASLVRQLNKLD